MVLQQYCRQGQRPSRIHHVVHQQDRHGWQRRAVPEARAHPPGQSLEHSSESGCRGVSAGRNQSRRFRHLKGPEHIAQLQGAAPHFLLWLRLAKLTERGHKRQTQTRRQPLCEVPDQFGVPPRRNSRHPLRRRLRLPFGLNQLHRSRHECVAEEPGLILAERDFVAPARIAVHAEHAPCLRAQPLGNDHLGPPVLEPVQRTGQDLVEFHQRRLGPPDARLQDQGIMPQEINCRLDQRRRDRGPLRLASAVHALAAWRRRRIIQRAGQKLHQAPVVLDVALDLRHLRAAALGDLLVARGVRVPRIGSAAVALLLMLHRAINLQQLERLLQRAVAVV